MFKKDSIETKVLLLSLLATIVITIIALIGMDDYKDFAIALGLVSLAVGVFEIAIAFFFIITGKNEFAKSFFITAGILLLISGVSCSSMLFK